MGMFLLLFGNYNYMGICMQKLKAIIFVSFVGLTLNCKTRHSSHLKETATVNQDKKDSSTTLVRPLADFSSFLLGNIQMGQLTAGAPQFVYGAGAMNYQHHYDYEVCAKGSSSCQEGKIFFGAKIFPNLSPGEYTAVVKPCNIVLPSSETCGSVSGNLTYTQNANPNSGDLPNLIQQEVEITQKIKAQAAPIYAAYQNYASTLKNPSPSDPVAQSIAIQLNYGQDLIAELINSSSYLAYFTQIYAPNIGSTASAPSDNSVGSQQQAQIDALTAQVNSLQSALSNLNTGTTGTTNGTPSASPSSSTTSNALPKDLSAGGAILISLGSIGFLVGAIITIASYRIPGLASSQVEGFGTKFNKWLKNFFSKTANVTLPEFHEQLNIFLEANIPPIYSQIQHSLDDAFKNMDLANLIDVYADMSRNLAGSSLGANTKEVNKDFLHLRYGGEGRFNDRFTSYTLDSEKGGGSYYVDKKKSSILTHETFVYYVDSEEKVFQKGVNLFGVPISIESEGHFISASDYQNLATEIQTDFKPTEDGRYICESESIKEKYINIEGKLFRKTANFIYWPRIPQLHPDTLQNLNANYVRLQNRGYPNASMEFGKGVPLFDIYGRLVEPPDAWKVAGRNWISGPAASTLGVRGYYDSTEKKDIHVKDGNYLSSDHPAVKDQVLSFTDSTFKSVTFTEASDRLYRIPQSELIGDAKAVTATSVIGSLNTYARAGIDQAVHLWKFEIQIQDIALGLHKSTASIQAGMDQGLEAQKLSMAYDIQINIKRNIMYQLDILLISQPTLENLKEKERAAKNEMNSTQKELYKNMSESEKIIYLQMTETHRARFWTLNQELFFQMSKEQRLVYLDMTPEQIREFNAKTTSPQKFQFVDKLVADKRKTEEDVKITKFKESPLYKEEGNPEKFSRLSHDEQVLASSLDEGEAKAYLQMDRAQRSAFAAHSMDERVKYLSLKPEEKAAYALLSTGQRLVFLDMSPEERLAFLKLSPSAKLDLLNAKIKNYLGSLEVQINTKTKELFENKSRAIRTSISTNQKSLSKYVREYAHMGKIGGIGTILVSIGAIVGGLFVPNGQGQSLALAENDAQINLLNSLKSIEKTIAELQKQRLQVLQQINSSLQKTFPQSPIPDPEWVFHL